jgi:hypothetical protein
MHDAEINDAITKLYEKVDTYSAEDWWYFDVPLAIWLRKPLRSRQRWLVIARILANNSADQAMIRQTILNQYFTHLLSIWTVWNASLETDWISSRVCPDESIESIWCPYAGSRLKKIPSHSLWLGISLLYLCWCRRPSYYSCQKM